MQQQLVPQVAEKLATAPASIEGGTGREPSASEAKGDQQSMYALHLATQGMSRQAKLADNPALIFQRAVAARRAGQAKASQSLLSPLRHREADDPWGQCARAEQWLAEARSGEAPKVVTLCRNAEARPRLDGILNEACWQADAAGATAAGVRWAHDAEYLYVAVQCDMLPSVTYPAEPGARPRDGDVERHDHVRLLVDVDRDYASWFELLVDSRGWTADRCWGDAAWNPKWFVAQGASPDGTAWTIEAAIPLGELTARPPVAGEAWACSSSRMAPGAERPATDGPESVGPQGFSLLLFE
jgi:hypothetical protein